MAHQQYYQQQQPQVWSPAYYYSQPPSPVYRPYQGPPVVHTQPPPNYTPPPPAQISDDEYYGWDPESGESCEDYVTRVHLRSGPNTSEVCCVPMRAIWKVVAAAGRGCATSMWSWTGLIMGVMLLIMAFAAFVVDSPAAGSPLQPSKQQPFIVNVLGIFALAAMVGGCFWTTLRKLGCCTVGIFRCLTCGCCCQEETFKRCARGCADSLCPDTKRHPVGPPRHHYPQPYYGPPPVYYHPYASPNGM